METSSLKNVYFFVSLCSLTSHWECPPKWIQRNLSVIKMSQINLLYYRRLCLIDKFMLVKKIMVSKIEQTVKSSYEKKSAMLSGLIDFAMSSIINTKNNLIHLPGKSNLRCCSICFRVTRPNVLKCSRVSVFSKMKTYAVEIPTWETFVFLHQIAQFVLIQRHLLFKCS